jgi:hypothetical protein
LGWTAITILLRSDAIVATAAITITTAVTIFAATTGDGSRLQYADSAS